MSEDQIMRTKKALEEFLGLFNIKLDNVEKESGSSEQLLDRAQEKLDEFNEKAEAILTKTGKTPEELEVYASNRNNFTKEQWDALGRLKEEIAILKTAGLKIQDDLQKKVEKERGTQYHRFGKKKNWLPL